MAYNKAREEKKWNIWKEKEEQQLRELGMDEGSIQKLRQMDWEDFNAERRYQEHLASVPEYSTQQSAGMPEPEIQGIGSLLNAIDNEELFHILLEADRKTLQILLLKIMGFSVSEIARQTGMSDKAVYCRMDRLKKKIKKIY